LIDDKQTREANERYETKVKKLQAEISEKNKENYSEMAKKEETLNQKKQEKYLNDAKSKYTKQTREALDQQSKAKEAEAQKTKNPNQIQLTPLINDDTTNGVELQVKNKEYIDQGSGSFSSTSDVSDLTSSPNSSPYNSRANSVSSFGSNQEQEQGQGQKPVQVQGQGPEITEIEFNNAIVAIKQLFNMKTINDLKLSNVTIKKDNLLKKIKENKPQDNDQITYIINHAFDFYKFAHGFKSSIPFTEIKMFRDYIRYDYINSMTKNLLKQIYENFYEEYKKLGFSNSNIYLKPRLNNNQTRKNQSNILCDKISQLIQPMYSNRTIPSQIPNLTKRNITKKVVKDMLASLVVR
jgi:hypothetical protein